MKRLTVFSKLLIILILIALFFVVKFIFNAVMQLDTVHVLIGVVIILIVFKL